MYIITIWHSNLTDWVSACCVASGKVLIPPSRPQFTSLWRGGYHCLIYLSIYLFTYVFIYLSIYLFIYLWLRWVFVAARGLSLVAGSRGYSSLQCAGFSLWWLLLLQSTGSRHTGFSSCGSQALERRLSSCGARAQLPRGTWDLPGPGLKPVSPALADGFLTIAPPGKPNQCLLDIHSSLVLWSHCENGISEHWTIVPRRNIGLGSWEPLVTMFSSTDQFIVCYVWFCLKTPCLVYIVDPLTLNSWPTALRHVWTRHI